MTNHMIDTFTSPEKIKKIDFGDNFGFYKQLTYPNISEWRRNVKK